MLHSLPVVLCRIFLRSAAVAFVLHANSQAETPSSLPTLHFTNGDQLTGELRRIEGDDLVWHSPALAAETRFRIDQIESITYPALPLPERQTDHLAHIRMNPDLRQQIENLPGDVIEGQLLSVKPQHLQLSTWYAGTLTLNRNMIRDMEITDVSPMLYYGPREAQEWRIDPPDSWKWESQAYTLTANGTLAKEFPSLPQRYCFRFKAAWKNRFQLQIFFGADSADEENPENHYMIMLDNGTSYLQKRIAQPNPNGGNGQNGGMIGEYKRDQAFRSKEKSELRLFVDTTTGIIALYSDDTLIQQWNDLDPPFLQGRCIHLRQNSGQFYPMKVSEMSLSEWDGSLPHLQEQTLRNNIPPPTPRENEQPIILRNGDIVIGEVQQVDQSNITLKTRFNQLQLPISRIKKLALTPAEYDERILQNGDVRAWFPNGNSIVFRLIGTDPDGRLLGESQHFGTARFNPQAFTKIDFNLYR